MKNKSITLLVIGAALFASCSPQKSFLGEKNYGDYIAHQSKRIEKADRRTKRALDKASYYLHKAEKEAAKAEAILNDVQRVTDSALVNSGL